MNQAQFELQAHNIQTEHDKACEEWNEGHDAGDFSWEEMRKGIGYQNEETLKSLRALVNNHLYGVNSWAVYHHDGVRTNEDGVPYPTSLRCQECEAQSQPMSAVCKRVDGRVLCDTCAFMAFRGVYNV